MNMEDTIRLDSVLCVVDCLNVEKNFEQFEIAMAQIQYADIVLLSKHTMLDTTRLDTIEKLVYKFSPYTRILKITDDLPLELIIDTNKFDHTTIEELEIEDEKHHKHREYHAHHDYTHDDHHHKYDSHYTHHDC